MPIEKGIGLFAGIIGIIAICVIEFVFYYDNKIILTEMPGK